MSAFKVDYKYRHGLKEISTTEVDPKNIKVTDKLSSWSTGPLRRYYIDDCVKYIGKDIEIDFISENGFSREVTFYERN